MRIIYKEIHDGHEVGDEDYTERTLARRLCRDGKAIPYQTHLDNIYDAEQAKIKADKESKAAKEKENAEKKKADEEKKAVLLAKRKEDEAEKADSKKVSKSEKAVKPKTFK